MSDPTKQLKKSGFAVLIGRSNVGKSTLVNSIVGTKVAITTPKPQTTRLPIHGILTTDEGQVVFVDTPGIFQKSRDRLTSTLLDLAKQSLKDVDVIVYVVDPTRAIGDEEKFGLRMIEHIEKPKILVINKIDLRKTPFTDFYRDLAGKFSETVEVSALEGTHVKALVQRIFSYLKEGEPFYPEFQLTSLPNEQWIAELIREKLFMRLRQEVPYSTHVEVKQIEKRENGVMYIEAVVYTTDKRYQGMIIGKGGRGIKEIGQSTRNELEAVTDQKIFLDLHVEVDPHWVERLV